jgi:hypothetical protein
MVQPIDQRQYGGESVVFQELHLLLSSGGIGSNAVGGMQLIKGQVE